MKILITGAHFTPALAVVEELKKFQNTEIVYVGRKTTQEGDKTISQESQILPKMGVKYLTIITGRLRRNFDLLTILSLLKLPIGFIQAFYIILNEKPDVILSFGGYVAVPLVIVGWLWSIPILVHEQTLVSGLANKISAKFADKIAVGFEANSFAKKDNAIITGNPIREEFLNPKGVLSSEYKKIFQEAHKNKLSVILITGGNQGSHTINKAVEDSLDDLLKVVCIIHQTGDSNFKDYERLMDKRSFSLSKQSDRYLVKKFIDNMGTILSQVDLIVSRAGINTLVEAAYLHKPVLAIPFPFLYQNEQVKNAKYFEGLGLVRILYQSELNAESFKKNILDMLKKLPSLENSALKSSEVVKLGAAKRLAVETVLLVDTEDL